MELNLLPKKMLRVKDLRAMLISNATKEAEWLKQYEKAGNKWKVGPR